MRNGPLWANAIGAALINPAKASANMAAIWFRKIMLSSLVCSKRKRKYPSSALLRVHRVKRQLMVFPLVAFIKRQTKSCPSTAQNRRK